MKKKNHLIILKINAWFWAVSTQWRVKINTVVETSSDHGYLYNHRSCQTQLQRRLLGHYRQQSLRRDYFSQ